MRRPISARAIGGAPFLGKAPQVSKTEARIQRGDRAALAVLADLDIDALVLGNLAREPRHVDPQHLSVLLLLKHIGEHAQTDHHHSEQKGEHRTYASACHLDPS